MFELLEKTLRSRDYFGAGAILTSIGELLRPPQSRLPTGFFNAQMSFLALGQGLHIFCVLEAEGDWLDLPGEPDEPVAKDGVFLKAKRLALGEIWNPVYPDGITFHFLFVDDLFTGDEPCH